MEIFEVVMMPGPRIEDAKRPRATRHRRPTVQAHLDVHGQAYGKHQRGTGAIALEI
jgi:hypothetical protein